MNGVLDQRLVDRLAAEHPRAYVHELAAHVREDHRRRPFENPNGVLVHRVRRVQQEIDRAEEARGPIERQELERYAEAQAAMYRLCSERSLNPEQVAACLDGLFRNGFGKLNVLVIEKLRGWGSTWPQFPPLPPLEPTQDAGAGVVNEHGGLGAGADAQGG